MQLFNSETIRSGMPLSPYCDPNNSQFTRQSGAYNGASVKQVKAECYISKAVGAIGQKIKKAWEVTTPILSRFVSVILYPFKWLVENRFGMAKLVGFAMVPSQFDAICHSARCVKKVNDLCNKRFPDGRSYEPVTVRDGNTELKAIICYPPNWDKESNNTARCILFHNPNGMLVSDLFDDDKLSESLLPGYLQSLRNCPVMIYDYRGTGLNKTSSSPWPTGNTIVQDASAVLKFTNDKFHHVEVVGTSLGGGVATISLEEALGKNGSISADRVSLVNHASFTTAARVVLPGCSRLADALGWMVGGNVNALKPMKKLIHRKVPITVMNNLEDPVICKGARMSDSVRKIKDIPHVRTVEDRQPWVHVQLTPAFKKFFRDQGYDR